MVTWNIRVLSPILHHLYQSCMAYHLRSTSANSSGHRTCFDKMKQRFSLQIFRSASWLISSSSTDKISGLWFCWVVSVWWRHHPLIGATKKSQNSWRHLDHKSSQFTSWGERFPIENGWKWEVFLCFFLRFSFEMKSILIQSAQSSQEWNL